MVLELTPASLLLTFAAILLFGFAGQWLFQRTKVPDTLLLILLGFVIGILFDIDKGPFFDVMPFVGVLALIVILFDGGLELRFADLVSGLPRASALALSGFLLSVVGIAVFGRLFLGLDFMRAAMLGAIVGGTSAVVVLPMVPGLKLGKRSETIIGLESALTDVLAVVVTLALAGSIAAGRADGVGLAQGLIASFTVALALGLLAGVGWLALIGHVRKSRAEYVWLITALLGIYGLVELVGGSGPIAILAFAVILGNARKVTTALRLTPRQISTTMKRRHGELTFFVRSFFFVFLGLVLDPSFFGIGGAAADGNGTNGMNGTANGTTNGSIPDGTLAGTGNASIAPDALIQDPILASVLLFLVLVAGRIAAVWVASLRDPELIRNRIRLVLLMPRGLAAAVLAAIPAAAPYDIEGIGSFVGYAFAILLLSNVSAAVAAFIDPEKLEFRRQVRKEVQERWQKRKDGKGGRETEGDADEDADPGAGAGGGAGTSGKGAGDDDRSSGGGTGTKGSGAGRKRGKATPEREQVDAELAASDQRTGKKR